MSGETPKGVSVNEHAERIAIALDACMERGHVNGGYCLACDRPAVDAELAALVAWVADWEELRDDRLEWIETANRECARRVAAEAKVAELEREVRRYAIQAASRLGQEIENA